MAARPYVSNLIAVEIRTSLTFETDGSVGEAPRTNKGGNHMFDLSESKKSAANESSGDDPQNRS